MAINQSVDVPMFAAGTQHTFGPLTALSVLVRLQRSPGSDVCPGSSLGVTATGDARNVAASGRSDESLPQAASRSPHPHTNEDARCT
jgi:hypothetical protein